MNPLLIIGLMVAGAWILRSAILGNERAAKYHAIRRCRRHRDRAEWRRNASRCLCRELVRSGR